MAADEENGRGIGPQLQFDENWISYQRGELFQQPNVVNPYGTYTHEGNVRAIRGMANWTDIWTDWDHVGDDFTLRADVNETLHPMQMTSMMDSALTVLVKRRKLLGKGGYGKVWLVDYKKRVPVTDETPDGWSEEMRAAAKIMRLREADKDNDQDMTKCVNKLLVEMRALIRLTNFNKNMVHLLEVICVPDSVTNFPFSSILMLMEVCHGDLINLYQVSGHCINHLVCRKWMRDITNALLYMHSRNAVHLDIKPDNIMFQRIKNRPDLTKDILLKEYPTMTFKLGDFGFCEIYDSDQTAVTTNNAGTEVYQSPELKQSQLRKAGIRSKPCDIYSLGMTLASCLMPVNRFDLLLRTGTMQQRIAQYLSGQLSDPNHNITREVAYVLYDMLHTDPTRRLTIDQLSKKLWLTKGVSKRTLPLKYKRGQYQWFPRRDNKR